MSNSDRSLVRQVMRQIERKTCVRFQEKSSKRPPSGINIIKVTRVKESWPLLGHHLEIRVLSNNTCMGRTRRGGGHPRFARCIIYLLSKAKLTIYSRFSAAVFAQPPARKKVTWKLLETSNQKSKGNGKNRGSKSANSFYFTNEIAEYQQKLLHITLVSIPQ